MKKVTSYDWLYRWWFRWFLFVTRWRLDHLQLPNTGCFTVRWPAGVASVIVGGLCAPPAPLHHLPQLEKQARFGAEAMEGISTSRGQCWFVHTCAVASQAGREPVTEARSALRSTAFIEMNNEQWLVGGRGRMRKIKKMNAKQSKWHICVWAGNVWFENDIIGTEAVNCGHPNDDLLCFINFTSGCPRDPLCSTQMSNAEKEKRQCCSSGMLSWSRDWGASRSCSVWTSGDIVWQVSSVVSLRQDKEGLRRHFWNAE